MDISSFCAGGPSAFFKKYPWFLYGKTIATDAGILVCARDIGPWPSADPELHPIDGVRRILKDAENREWEAPIISPYDLREVENYRCDCGVVDSFPLYPGIYVNGIRIQVKYLVAILSIDGIAVSPEPQKTSGSNRLFFKGSGCVGVIASIMVS